MRSLVLVLCVLLLPRPLAAADKPAEKDKRTPLFDGKTFQGWDGDLKVFRIEDGAIVGGSLKQPLPRNEFLRTRQQYADFELRLKFKLLGKGVNAGVQIRSQRASKDSPHPNEMIGYQADLGDGYWGCLYDESRRNKVLAGPPKEKLAEIVKPDDWNQYVIRCQGRRIQLWLNGTKTVDYSEPDAKIPQTGLIGLQIHGGPPSEAWYKDITINQLPAE